MEDAQELLRSVLRGSGNENTEDLDIKVLDNKEKRECLLNSSFDIDFCAFTGVAERLFDDPAVNRSLSNHLGTFVKRPYHQRLYGHKHMKVLTICDIKPFKIALSITDCHTSEEEELIQISETNDNDCHESSNFVRNVTDLLGEDAGKTFAFRDVRGRMSTLFAGFEVIVFQYGQKEEIENFLAHVEKIGPETKLNVAVGLELKLDSFLLLSTPDLISIGECFYPMLLTRTAGSILCSHRQAPKLIPASRR